MFGIAHVSFLQNEFIILIKNNKFAKYVLQNDHIWNAGYEPDAPNGLVQFPAEAGFYALTCPFR